MSKKKLSFIVLLTCLAALMFSTMAYARNLVDNYTVFVKNNPKAITQRTTNMIGEAN